MIGKKEAQIILKKGREIEWRRGTETERETVFFFGLCVVVVMVVLVFVFMMVVVVMMVLVFMFMMVVVVMMVLVVVDFFSLFYTFTKVQFILHNAVI